MSPEFDHRGGGGGGDKYVVPVTWDVVPVTWYVVPGTCLPRTRVYY